MRDRENGKKTRDVPKNFYFVNNIPLVSNYAINLENQNVKKKMFLVDAAVWTELRDNLRR